MTASRTRILGLLVTLPPMALLAAACATAPPPDASPAASPAFTLAEQCERDGGRWHADKNVCEYQAPSPGLPRR